MYTVEGGGGGVGGEKKWNGEREKRGEEDEREVRRRKTGALLRRRAYIAVAGRSYLIQSWIMLRQDGDVYTRDIRSERNAPRRLRVLTPDAQVSARPLQVFRLTEREMTFARRFIRRFIRFAHNDDTSVKRGRESLWLSQKKKKITLLLNLLRMMSSIVAPKSRYVIIFSVHEYRA